MSIPRRSTMKKPDLTICTNLDDVETTCSSVTHVYSIRSIYGPLTPLSPDSLDSVTHSFSSKLEVSSPHCIIEGCTMHCAKGKLACKKHDVSSKKAGRPMCQEEGCTSRALDSVTNKCTRHGGGPRCTQCGKPSMVGGLDLCFGCAGLKRCTAFGCKRAQVGESGVCERHIQISP